jgi:hypothetical protein
VYAEHRILTGGVVTDGLGAPSGPKAGMCRHCGVRRVYSRGLCRRCYLQHWLSGRPKCAFQGCGLPSRSKGYCQSHYKQLLDRKGLRPLRTSQRRLASDVDMLEFQRDRVQYDLRLERDAYRCSITVEARLFHKGEVARLEAVAQAIMQKGGA